MRFVDIRADRSFTSAEIKQAANPSLWLYKNVQFDNIYFSQEKMKYPLIYVHGFSKDYPSSAFTFKDFYFKNKKIHKSMWSDKKFISLRNTANFLFL
jgi:hypothetical protein